MLKFELRFPSLVQQYIAFCVAIMVLSIGISLFFSYLNFKNFTNGKDFIFKKEALELQHKFDDKIYYIENTIKYLAQLLVKSENYSYTNISYLIQNQGSRFDTDILTTSVIDYIDIKGRMIIDSIEGIRKSPIIISGMRSWFNKARQKPWQLHFNDPDYGIVSDQYIIPIGLGVADDKNIVRGFLSLGIEIMKLMQYLDQDIDGELNAIIFNSNNKFIATTKGRLSPNKVSLYEKQLQSINLTNDFEPHKLDSPFVLNSNIYTHYIHSEKYPFYMVLGEDVNSYYDTFRDEIIFLIIKNIFIGVFSSMILLLFAYQIIKPILELGKNAKAISLGKVVEFKQYPTEELNILSNQLKGIQTINRDLCSKQALLTKANNKLVSANNFIKSNMSFMTHELKNPTLSLIGFSEELLADKTSQMSNENRKFIDMMRKIAEYQNKQIDYFLQLFKFQETGKDLEKEPLNLEELIFWNISMLKYLANSKKVRVMVEIMPGMPQLIGDKIMIGQLIQNMVSNGIKYNKEGGVLKVKVYTQNSHYKREIILRFEDEGAGIPKKDIKKLFKKFERIKNSEYNKTFGYGLGLSYVKSCVASHDGEIYIATRPGQGSTFTISFPNSRIFNETEANQQ